MAATPVSYPEPTDLDTLWHLGYHQAGRRSGSSKLSMISEATACSAPDGTLCSSRTLSMTFCPLHLSGPFPSSLGEPSTAGF